MRFNFTRLLVLGVIGVLGVLGVLGVMRKKMVLPVGKTNLLVLGVPGAGQTGADLTDMMMWVSVNYQTGKVTVLSLPRDIWIPEWRTKLNSVYHYKGLSESKKVVSGLVGQETTYAVVVDYTLFEKVVDFLGGVEVTIDRDFTDKNYPLAGKENDECDGDKEYRCRYETVTFLAGKQILDGLTALKYVRSRQAEGEEGTDFARSARQQKLVGAIVRKISSWVFLRDPRRPLHLIKVIKDGLVTDLSDQEYYNLIRFALTYHQPNLQLTALNGGFLINPPPSAKYDNQWVLVPKEGDWLKVREYVKNLID